MQSSTTPIPSLARVLFLLQIGTSLNAVSTALAQTARVGKFKSSWPLESEADGVMSGNLPEAFKNGSMSKGQAGKGIFVSTWQWVEQAGQTGSGTQSIYLERDKGGCSSYRLLKLKAEGPSPLPGSFSAPAESPRESSRESSLGWVGVNSV